MSKGIIAVIDENQDYSRNLCAYLENHCDKDYTTACFFSIEDFKASPHLKNITFLLINESFVSSLEDIISAIQSCNNHMLNIERIYILSSNKYDVPVPVPGQSDTYIKTIYLYQSADAICKLIYTNSHSNSSCYPSLSKTSTTTIYGVYSPIKRSGRTSFALALAMCLSLKAPTLFISFDENASNYLSFSTDARTISDTLVRFIEHPEGIYNFIHSSKVNMNGLDIIPPSRYSQDIRNLPNEIILSFIKELYHCEYTHVLIDFSDSCNDIVSLLLQCNKIYMPTIDDDISQCKISNFNETSYQVDNRYHKLDIEMIHVPIMNYVKDSSSYINQLMLSPISSYINGLLT